MSKLYPIKVLLDENKQPFLPFTTSKSIVVDGTEYTIQDLFDMRYTKEEVDAIIESLGTLQRLCGRVATYDDLLLIEDKQPGDTYIVGTSESENSEYMWIGEKWEKLGPLVDLTDYYSKEEIDAFLASAEATTAGAIAQGDNETLNLAKNYAEDKIAEAMSSVSLDGALVYKGHVGSVDSLPDLGQPTGGTQPIGRAPVISNQQLNQLFLNDTTSDSSTASYLSGQGYSYYLGLDYPKSVNTYNYGSIGIMTNYPECVSIALRYSGYSTMNIYKFMIFIKYDPNKPVYYRYKSTSGSTYRPYIRRIVDGAVSETQVASTGGSTATAVLVDADMLLFPYESRLFTAEQDDSTPIDQTIKVRVRTNIPKIQLSMGLESDGSSYYVSMLTNSDGYIWNPGMNLLGSASGDGNNMKFYKNITETTVKPNDTYTVGHDYDIYVCDEDIAWRNWARNKGYSKEEIDAMFGEAEAALDEIIEGV